MKAKRAVEVWRSFWFRKGSLVDLAIARAILAGIVLYLGDGGLRFLRPAMVPASEWSPIPFARFLGLEQPSLATVVWLWRIERVALFATCFGVLTNLSLSIVFAVQLVLETALNCLGKVTHGTIPLLYALLFFALSPCGRRLSVDAAMRRALDRWRGRPARVQTVSGDASWPFELLFVELAAFYFQAGFAKLSVGGLGWADGYTLQFYLLEKARPAGLWLAPHLRLCRALSASVLAFELGFPIAVFLRRLRPIFLAGGFLFHLGTTVFMDVAFWPVWALYLLFVPWRRMGGALAHAVRRARRRPSRVAVARAA